MQLFNLNDMIKGWFIGSFKPSVVDSNDFEVACKRYRQGDYEECHVHKVSTEITLIVEGSVRMQGRDLHANDIVMLNPGEPSDFLALSDAVTVVVKFPSRPDDKYKI